jgi:hypothetical protein
VELQHEEIVIERVAGSGAPTSGGAFKEETVFIPLRREKPVIQKETRVREEVRVGKKREAEHRTVSESVRNEDVEVENQQNPRIGAEVEPGRARSVTRRRSAVEIAECNQPGRALILKLGHARFCFFASPSLGANDKYLMIQNRGDSHIHPRSLMGELSAYATHKQAGMTGRDMWRQL